MRWQSDQAGVLVNYREFRDCDRDTERDRDRGPGKRVEGAKTLHPYTDTQESGYLRKLMRNFYFYRDK